MPRWDDEMGLALGLAREAAAEGEIPIGALVLDASGAVVGRGRNATGRSPSERRETGRSPSERRESSERRETEDRSVGELRETGRSPSEARRAETKGDPTAHAEIVAIRAAADALGTSRLDGCTLVVTLEPCVMCAGAVLQSRLSRLVFGAWDEKAGAVGGRFDVIREAGLPHDVEVVSGVRADESAALLRDFFADRR